MRLTLYSFIYVEEKYRTIHTVHWALFQ